jgi:hypothetical protein
MADLDRSLRTLGVDWPPTPDVAARLELAPRRRRRELVAAAALAAALVAAFAVPQSRSAILRFFGIGGVTIERVSTLPAAAERPLGAGLGPRLTDAEAEAMLGAPFRPASHGTLYGRDGIVSTLLAAPEPVLLTELGSAAMLKKLVGGSTRIESVEIAPGVEGLWLSGAEHVVFFFPHASPRLAGNVLAWTSGRLTFRLEGRALTRERALALARTILGTATG